MFDFIDLKDEVEPDWNDEKRCWMGICEHIAAHWYFLMTMEEFTVLFNLRYPEETVKSVRDAYVFQYYSEMMYRGEKVFDNNISERDTLLTPTVSDGIEYLVRNSAEEKEELFDKARTLHAKRPMYVPTIEEMEEFFNYGFNPSDDAIMDAFENLSELVDFKNSVRGKLGASEEAVNKENANRDHLAQGVVLNIIDALEKGIQFNDIVESIMKNIPFKDEEKAVEYMRDVYNHTHLPGNHGGTPMCMK